MGPRLWEYNYSSGPKWEAFSADVKEGLGKLAATINGIINRAILCVPSNFNYVGCHKGVG
jgi:hypothetical protein